MAITDANTVYLDCGCAILEDGSRTWCPSCEGPGMRFWECPDCGFAFDAIHQDADGGYSCPCCSEARLLNMIDQLIDLGFQPKLCSHFGRRVVTLYQGTTTPWGDGGEGDTWEDALEKSLVILENNGYKADKNVYIAGLLASKREEEEN